MLRYLLEKEFKQIRRDRFMPKIIFIIPIMQLIILPFAANFEMRNINLSIVDNLPSIAPNTIINVNPPKILPIPLFTESGSFSNGMPKAMPAKIEEIRNAMKASTLK
jgi:hypothetical protein